MGGSGRLLALVASAALVVALATTAWAVAPVPPGPAYSWGDNDVYRLGVGFASSLQALPTPIAAPGQFTSISAGYNHGCALGGDDSAYCWGRGASGQLGNAATDDTWTPVRALGPPGGFAAIAAGYITSCGIQDDTAAAYCWGNGGAGQLGNGTLTNRNVPTLVSGGYAFSGISIGYDSACGVTTDDTGYCWGTNDRGQLGDGTFTDDSVPSAVVDVTGSTFTNRTTTNGLGNNTIFGVYTTGSTVYAATFGGLSISTNGGSTFTNKTTSNGLGSNTVYGVYTTDDTVYAATSGGLSISTNGGSTFTNKTTSNGLGNNTVNSVYAAGSTVYAATFGGLAISTDGGSTFTNRTTSNGLGYILVKGVYAIGSKVYAATDGGGLSISTDGGSTFTNRTTTNGLGSNTVYGVYAAGSTVYAATFGGLSISTDGGSTFTNRTTTNGLGNNRINGVFAAANTVYAGTNGGLSISSKGFAEVSAGDRFACGVTKAIGTTGPGVCWGFNEFGKLGRGSATAFNSAIPALIARPVGMASDLVLKSISSGKYHACAISTDDSAYCWGLNSGGQLGINSTDDSVATPTRVLIPGSPPVRDISAGIESSCAITDDTAYCWGRQVWGQLGNGQTAGEARAPVAVTLSGIGAANSPVQVTSGEAYNAFIVQPRMTFAGTAFPSAQVGQATSTLVPVQNTRPWTITITGTSVTGAGVTRTGTTCSGALPSGETCTVSLAWTPASIGALSGASLTVNYVGNSSSTPLTGTATDPTPPPPPPTFPPGPPGDAAATAGDASATVTWTAPTSPGSFPVTHYQVTSSPGEKSCLTSALTCTVTGLTNGTTYTFTVKALSGAGWGASSTPSNAVTPTAPPPPPTPSILITGTRDGQRIIVTGTSLHLDSQAVRPWIKFPGQLTYTEGTAVIPVATDGTFTWSRKSGKKIYVYIAHGTVKSNTVTVSAR